MPFDARLDLKRPALLSSPSRLARLTDQLTLRANAEKAPLAVDYLKARSSADYERDGAVGLAQY